MRVLKLDKEHCSKRRGRKIPPRFETSCVSYFTYSASLNKDVSLRVGLKTIMFFTQQNEFLREVEICRGQPWLKVAVPSMTILSSHKISI